MTHDKISQLSHTNQTVQYGNRLYVSAFSSILQSHYMVCKSVHHTVDEQTIEQSNLINLNNMKVSKKKIGN